jgi:hypothetical protein
MIFRHGESNPGLAGILLVVCPSLRAADASHYTITDVVVLIKHLTLIRVVKPLSNFTIVLSGTTV